MIILDTNVLSELMKPQGSETVLLWVDSQPISELFITSISQAEILYGIAILPAGAKKQTLYKTAQLMFKTDFVNKILSFEQSAAPTFAAIASHRRKQGKPISTFDAQIAAICRYHQATIATRNVKDFVDCSIEIVNPWKQ